MPAPLLIAAIIMSLLAPGWTRAGGRDSDRHDHDSDDRDQAEVVRPNERYHGLTYAEWSAATMKWAMELPLAGHPANDTPDFDVAAGQIRKGLVPGRAFWHGCPQLHYPKKQGTVHHLGQRRSLQSGTPESGFHGDTEAERRAVSKFWADHIVDAFCVIDGKAVKHIEHYRVSSPQFEFSAPTPWLFGDVGGDGLSVGDGYYVW